MSATKAASATMRETNTLGPNALKAAASTNHAPGATNESMSR